MKIQAKLQQGFTLIELMIVVAIIGILAAIAIPQYQNYVARAQVTEAVSLMSGGKTALEEYIANNGSFPDGTTAGQSLADLGITPNGGSYVGSIAIDNGSNTDSAGRLTATMKASGVAAEIQSLTVSLTRGTDGSWTCSPGAASAIPVQFLPTSCRNTVAASF